MEHARIAELLEPFLGRANDQQLTANDLAHISTYIDILQRWNARVNLTAIRTEEEIVTRHFGESLFAAQHLFPKQSRGAADAPVRRVEHSSTAFRLTDIGSGAGFPGIPIKLWAPHIHVTLIESNHKKATFLREVARALTLTDIDIQNARAESLAEQTFDTLTLRAVERFKPILPIAAGLLKPTGRLAILIGSAQLLQVQSALPKWDWSDSQPIPLSQNRVFVVGHHSKT